MYRKYEEELKNKIKEEYINGFGYSHLETKYGTSRNTIKYWIENSKKNQTKSEILKGIEDNISMNKELYSYILGLYLGDGYVNSNKTSYRLRIAIDNRHPNLIEDIRVNLSKLFNRNVTINKLSGHSYVNLCYKYLPLYFPQHGVGKKHDRKIELSKFQLENIDHNQLMRGLFLSDGCRYLHSNKYEYFNFNNKSTDIIEIFEKCLLYNDIKYRKRMRVGGVWIIDISTKINAKKFKDIVGTKS